MKEKHWFLCLMLTLQSALFAQTLRSYERAGDQAYEQKDYAAAVMHYGSVLQRDDDNYSVWWKYAESARNYQAFAEADRAYKKLTDYKKQVKTYPLTQYHIGEIKKSRGDYAAAISAFTRFLDEKPRVEKSWFEQARQEIEACRKAQELALKPTGVQITHLSKAVNSPYSEFAPVTVGDTLFYSSYRFDRKNDLQDPPQKLTKVMISSKGGRGREPGRGFPSTDTAHIAHTAFSPDGHYVFFTVCNNINSSDIRCELWLTVLDRRNRWMQPVKLPAPINVPGHTTTQPTVAYDPHYQGPVLWFSSDRPGGKGKLDLWYTPLDTNFFCPCNLPFSGKKLRGIPDFVPPRNATVNTAGNDATPFYFPGTQMLYFSSDALPGLGGYDIFAAPKQADSLGTPKNVGPGLNTSYNDLYFYLKPDGKNGYLSSNREGSFYLDEANKACCNDLFSFKLPDEPTDVPPPPLDSNKNVVVKSPLPGIPAKSEPPTPEPAPVVAPEPVRLADFVGLPLYFDNDEPDKRTRRTETTKTYEATVQAYLTKQNEYREQFTTGLKGTEENTGANLIDNFFENEVRKGYDRLEQLCDVLLTRLQEGHDVEVLIKGFTSPRAESEYNLNLGKRRISSVRNHMAAFSEGALAPYIKSGQLKISETSFGETTAKSNISDRLNDLRNSVYHPDAARERRVEIVAIKEQ